MTLKVAMNILFSILHCFLILINIYKHSLLKSRGIYLRCKIKIKETKLSNFTWN